MRREKYETERHALNMRQELVGKFEPAGKHSRDGLLETIEAAVPAALRNHAFVLPQLRDFPHAAADEVAVSELLDRYKARLKTGSQVGAQGVCDAGREGIMQQSDLANLILRKLPRFAEVALFGRLPFCGLCLGRRPLAARKSWSISSWFRIFSTTSPP
jgi:hypothetical protein